MTWQTRSSMIPKVLSENQWQLHWLSVENESTHFQQAMQLYCRVRKKKKKKKNTRSIGTVLVQQWHRELKQCIAFAVHLQVILGSKLATIEEVEKVQIDFLRLVNILLVSVTGSESMASIMLCVSTRGQKRKKKKSVSLNTSSSKVILKS